ncbi:hypothetical protein CEXT_76581 [Caerostris extrusa]|uniref:Uncharacterized protein n=1 Tax=Caerostris extrusa TaxID=172846 RepID=A0AAV4WLR5_CAEEX|nr:hypothetical protein CEXT_76581 [Caerostris extrusa]
MLCNFCFPCCCTYPLNEFLKEDDIGILMDIEMGNFPPSIAGRISEDVFSISPLASDPFSPFVGDRKAPKEKCIPFHGAHPPTFMQKGMGVHRERRRPLLVLCCGRLTVTFRCGQSFEYHVECGGVF